MIEIRKIFPRFDVLKNTLIESWDSMDTARKASVDASAESLANLDKDSSEFKSKMFTLCGESWETYCHASLEELKAQNASRAQQFVEKFLSYAESYVKGITSIDELTIDENGVNGIIRGANCSAKVSTKMIGGYDRIRLFARITMEHDC